MTRRVVEKLCTKEVCVDFSPLFGRLIFIHLQCWEELLFCRFQRQRCIKIRVLKGTGFLYAAGIENDKRVAPPSTGGV